MRLKRLELFGFKSFADRTVLEFEGSLTGIVGPNGCGKSNVVDAVRWVLGETRPTSMRGGEMADVVFKGSVSRAAMSVAEVTMVLDNGGETLPDRGAEVSITRRVFTSGEGEYLIDGERVRLKDIKDMLFDTGLGSRGYSVLEQGRIDAVLSANPLDRRAIFEEAAGISRYRQRRKEAQSKLKRVDADLVRLDDVLRELGSRVRSLKIQAGKAERFVEARDAWRTERGRSLKHRLYTYRAQLAELNRGITELDARVETLREAREGEEGDVAAREREQQALANEVDRLADEVARLAGETRAADERHAQLLSRIEGWRRACEEESSRALELAGGLEVREAELEQLEERARAFDAEVAEAREAVEGEMQRLRETRNSHREARKTSEERNESVLGALHRKTAGKNALHHLEELRPTLEERRERAETRSREARSATEEMRATLGERRESLGAARTALTEAEEQERELGARLVALEEREAAARERRAEKELERERTTSRIEALRDRAAEQEALEAGARAVLQGAATAAGPFGPDDLQGLVADHLRTSTAYARALDGALGSAAQAIVARDAGLVGSIVGWLDEQKAGLARVVTPAGVAPPKDGAFTPLSGFDEGELARLDGRLLDHVQCAPEFEPLARLLVGDVLVAVDRDAALALAGAHPRWRFVTPTGDLVDAAGVFGGHRDLAHGPIGRRATADELERGLEAIELALSAADEELVQSGRERGEVTEARGVARAELETLRARAADATSETQTAEARLADLEESCVLVEEESAGTARELEQLGQDIEAARVEVGASEEHFGRENAALEAAELARGELEGKVEELQRQAARFEVDLTRAGAEREGLLQRISDLTAVVKESRTELERARRLATEHTAHADEAQLESERVREHGDLMLQQRGETERKLDELRTTERAGREAIEAYRRRVDAVTRELEDLTTELSERKLEEQRIRLAREELGVRAQEDLDASEAELLDGFEPEEALAEAAALSELDEVVAGLKSRLDRLGPVNTDAVEELDESSKRFDFLDGQRTDLGRSQKALNEAITQIDAESERLFLETFDEVRGHFQVLFRQLFGGGRADLALEEGVSPLEAGIDITARPPGREMLPIGLLSGGQRTMTALALLFAVFRSRPSPFCVLDEVDAALDDANIGRFLALLDTFRQTTQFIVVTHNKGSMVACDRMYGITMETKGVSSHVFVEFSEVDRFVPEAIGDAGEAVRAREEVQENGPELDTSYEVPRPEDEPAATPSSDGETVPAESGS
jgi:chromosome segregation protein